MNATQFGVVYDPALAQYIVERGELRVVPTPTPFKDEKALTRAGALAVALNRVYAAEPRKDARLNAGTAWHDSEDAGPDVDGAPLDAAQAEARDA